MTDSVIILDSSPLIALAIIDRLEILPVLYARVIAPPFVWQEVTVYGHGLPGAESIRNLPWLEIEQPDASLLQTLLILAGRGETEALALAQGIPESCILLDDARARRIAEHLGIRRIGTLGVLRKAKRKGLISELRPLVMRLQENGIYMRQELVETILRDVGEMD